MWRRAVDKCYHRFWLCLSSLIWTQIDLHNEPSVRHFTMRSKASIISSSCRPAAHTLLQPQESASLLSESLVFITHIAQTAVSNDVVIYFGHVYSYMWLNLWKWHANYFMCMFGSMQKWRKVILSLVHLCGWHGWITPEGGANEP